MPADRLAIVVVLGLLLLAAVVSARRLNARRFAKLAEAGPDWRVLGLEPDGRRTLIAFSTPSCAACHKAQTPAIDRVRQQLGHDAFRLVKIDAASQPRAARAFGVMTVPATVVLAASGTEVVALNHGFASSTKLIEQLQQAS